MFDISWTELMVIAVVAIIVVGPKDLPRALRALGRWTGKAKRMARDFQNQFNEALREAELDTIRREVEEVGRIDPMADMKKEVREIEKGLKTLDGKPAAKPADPELDGIAADKDTTEPAPRPAAEAAPAPADAKP